MLVKCIILCFDVCDGQVVKGVQFCNYEIIGDIVLLVKCYVEEGVDELVFYDIIVFSDGCVVDKSWVFCVVEVIDILFCVVGGIKFLEDVVKIFFFGVDKIFINFFVLVDLILIICLVDCFGVQCIVVGIDIWYDVEIGKYYVN